MGHLGVPWAVGGGAINDEVLARKLTYAMFGGGEGVTYATACLVKPLAVPGGFIRVSPGDYVITGRGAGQVRESYFGSVVSDDVVPITPTGGMGRSDLVVIRVEDSHVAGEPWPDPIDIANGPYVKTHVITDVPSTTTNVRQLGNNFSAITLARIDIPPSTATITSGMIKDFRSGCSVVSGPTPPPQVITELQIIEHQFVYHETEKMWTDTVSAPSNADEKLTNVLSSTWHSFPSAANWVVPIPSWATGVDCFIAMNNLRYEGDVWGRMRINLDGGVSLSATQEYDINYHGGPGPERMPIIISDTIAIPSALRGKAKRFKVETQLLAGTSSHTGRLQYYRDTSLYVALNFKQYPSFD